MPSTPNRSSPASSSRRLVVELPASRSTRATSTSTPTPTRARTRTASSSATPVHPHHDLPHLSKADELAADEAEEILEHLGGSARSKRHERLSRLREESHVEDIGDEIIVGARGAAEDEGEGQEIIVGGPTSKSTPNSVEGVSSTKDDPVETGVIAEGEDEDSESEADLIQSSGIVPSIRDDATADAVSEDDDAESSVVSATSASEPADSDDSTSATSSDSGDSDDGDDDDDDEDDEEEELEKLLKAARMAATKPATVSSEMANVDAISGGDELVAFGQDEAEQRRRKEAPIPDIAITKLPKPHLSFTADGTAKAAEPRSIIAGPSRPKSTSGTTSKTGPAPELDDRPYQRQMSKREKAAQPKKATASEIWSTLPAPKADLLPQMRKDYQALSLANSLDPKRFMKGGNRSGTIPDNFAIGTLVEAPRHLQDTTLTREKQYRPGQIVQDLTRDDVTGSYAKRKFGDLQKTRMDNGRGNGWKKKKGW